MWEDAERIEEREMKSDCLKEKIEVNSDQIAKNKKNPDMEN